MIYPLVRELNVSEGISVSLICSKMTLCSRAYFEWLERPKTVRDRQEEQIRDLLYDAHENDPAAGYRILKDDIAPGLAAAGLTASKNRVARICSKYGIYANHSNAHAKGGYRKPAPPSHDDLLRRQFKVSQPNAVWVTDITEHPTAEGKLYWCGFKDLCSSRIVGQAISTRMTADLACDALRDALQARGWPRGVIIHSDRGGQYNSKRFLAMLDTFGLKGSMGQVRTCADNAAMESFNALLQKNVLNQKRLWQTRAELAHRIYRWVNTRYNKERRQASLGRMTPQEYELVYFDILSNDDEVDRNTA